MIIAEGGSRLLGPLNYDLMYKCMSHEMFGEESQTKSEKNEC